MFEDLAGGMPARPPPDADAAKGVAMLQVIKGDSTLRHVNELIFEYNQMLIELGCDVGSFQVLFLCFPGRGVEGRCCAIYAAGTDLSRLARVSPTQAGADAEASLRSLLQDLETEMRELPGRYSPEKMGCIYVVYPVSSRRHPRQIARRKWRCGDDICECVMPANRGRRRPGSSRRHERRHVPLRRSRRVLQWRLVGMHGTVTCPEEHVHYLSGYLSRHLIGELWICGRSS